MIYSLGATKAIVSYSENGTMSSIQARRLREGTRSIAVDHHHVECRSVLGDAFQTKMGLKFKKITK